MAEIANRRNKKMEEKMKNFIFSNIANVFLIVSCVVFIANMIVLFVNCNSPIFGQRIVIPTIVYCLAQSFIIITTTKIVHFFNKIGLGGISLFLSVIALIFPIVGTAIIMAIAANQ